MEVVFARKSVEQSIRDTEDPEHQLRRSLGPIQLTAIGIGVIIGTGIFVLTGEAAGRSPAGDHARRSWPPAIVCGLAGLCYAEFASTVPVAGSAYTFSYASLGELIAWIIGWDLMLELALRRLDRRLGLVAVLPGRADRRRRVTRTRRPGSSPTTTTWWRR